jgi:hypothetical protein
MASPPLKLGLVSKAATAAASRPHRAAPTNTWADQDQHDRFENKAAAAAAAASRPAPTNTWADQDQHDRFEDKAAAAAAKGVPRHVPGSDHKRDIE